MKDYGENRKKCATEGRNVRGGGENGGRRWKEKNETSRRKKKRKRKMKQKQEEEEEEVE